MTSQLEGAVGQVKSPSPHLTAKSLGLHRGFHRVSLHGTARAEKHLYRCFHRAPVSGRSEGLYFPAKSFYCDDPVGSPQAIGVIELFECDSSCRVRHVISIFNGRRGLARQLSFSSTESHGELLAGVMSRTPFHARAREPSGRRMSTLYS
jgi:hypothetical protein